MKVFLKDIVYAEVYNRKVIIHTRDTNIEYYGKLQELSEICGRNVLHNRQIPVKTPENYSFANSTEEEIALNSETMIQKRQAVPHP